MDEHINKFSSELKINNPKSIQVVKDLLAHDVMNLIGLQLWYQLKLTDRNFQKALFQKYPDNWLYIVYKSTCHRDIKELIKLFQHDLKHDSEKKTREQKRQSDTNQETTNRETNRKPDRRTETKPNRETERRKTERKTDRRETDRKTDRKPNREIDR